MSHPAAAESIRNRRFRMPRTVGALMLREMSTTYGRTPGGYAWAIIEPIGAVAMFTLIFEVGLRIRVPALGTSFPVFFATGMLPFLMFNKISGKIAGAITFSRPLLFYPGVTFIDAILARLVLNVLTYLLVFYIVMSFLLLIFDARTILDFSPIGLSLLLAVILGLGIGVLNCYLFPVFPVWETVWGILTTPLMLISGVIFLYDGMPQFARDVLWWNPLIHITGLMRRGFYPTYDAAYVSVPYVLCVSLICLTLGLMLLYRYHKDILNR
jgi:capsular polysaccharide transport system permease protein